MNGKQTNLDNILQNVSVPGDNPTPKLDDILTSDLQVNPRVSRGMILEDAETGRLDPFLGGTQYLDEGLPYGVDIEQFRAMRQSLSDKWISGAIKGTSTFATATGKTVAGVGGGLVAATMAALGEGWDSDTVFKNPVIEALTELDEHVKARNPHYYTDAEMRESALQSLGSANFWSDKFLDGVGFFLSAMATGMGAAGVGAKLGLASTRLGQGINTFQAAVVGRTGESIIEANDTYEQTKQRLEERVKAGEINLSEEEIEEQAKQARAMTFGMNMALAVPDAYQLGKVIAWANKTGKASKTLIGTGRLATAAEQFVIESQEENYQLSVSNMAVNLANDITDESDELNARDYFNNVVGGMMDNFSTKEGQESMLLGGILGGGMGLIIGNPRTNNAETNQDPKKVKEWGNVMKMINKGISLDRAHKVAKENGDNAALRAIQSLSLANVAFTHMLNGTTEKLESDFEKYEKMSLEEFNKLDPTNQIETEQAKTEEITRLRQEYETYKDLYSKLDPKDHEAIRSNKFFLTVAEGMLQDDIMALEPLVPLAEAIDPKKRNRPVKMAGVYEKPAEILKKHELLTEDLDIVQDKLDQVTNNTKIQDEIIRKWDGKAPAPTKFDPPSKDDADESADFPVGKTFQLWGKPDENWLVKKGVKNDDGSETITAENFDGVEKTFNTKQQFESGEVMMPTPDSVLTEPAKGDTPQLLRTTQFSTFESIIPQAAPEGAQEAVKQFRAAIENDPNYKDNITISARKVPNKKPLAERIAKGLLGNVYYAYAKGMLMIPSTSLEFKLTYTHPDSGQVTELAHSIPDPSKYTNEKGEPFIFKFMGEQAFFEKFGFWGPGGQQLKMSEDEATLYYEKVANEQFAMMQFYSDLESKLDDSLDFKDINQEVLDFEATHTGFKFADSNWTQVGDVDLLKGPDGNMVIVDLNTNTDISSGEDYSDEISEETREKTGGRNYIAKVFHPTIKNLWVKIAGRPFSVAEGKEFMKDLNDAAQEATDEKVQALNDALFVAYQGGWEVRFENKNGRLRLDVFNPYETTKKTTRTFIGFTDNLNTMTDLRKFINKNAPQITLENNSAFKHRFPLEGATQEELQETLITNVQPDVVNGATLKYHPKSVEELETPEPAPDPIVPQEETNKEEEEAAKRIGNNPNVGDGPVFKTGEKAKNPIHLERAFKYLRGILPEDITSQDLSTVSNNIEFLQYTWGMYYNSVVYLSRFAEEGTQYHEAFHAVFRLLMTPQEKSKLYEAGRKKWGNRPDEEIEELLADEFMVWKNNRSVRTAGPIRAFFNKVLTWIKALTGKEDTFEAAFRAIDEGQFSSRTVKETGQYFAPAYKLLRGAYTEDGKPIVKMGTVRSQNIIFSTAAYVLKRVKSDRHQDTLDELIETLSRDFLNDLALKYDPKQSFNKDVTGEEAHKMLHMKMILKDEINQSLIATEVRRILNNYNISEQVITEEDFSEENDEAERVFDTHQGEVGGWKNVAKEIKQFIALTTIEETDADFDVVYTRAIDFHSVYAALQRRLAGIKDHAQMMKEFKRFALLGGNPHVKAVYDKLIQETGYDEATGPVTNEQLYKRFMITFELEPIDYMQVLRTPDPKTKKSTLLAFSANRKSPGRILFNRWETIGREKDVFRKADARKSTLTKLANAIGAFSGTKNEVTDKMVTTVSNALYDIGVEVSTPFIKESLEVAHDIIKDDNATRYLNKDDLRALQFEVKRGGNVFAAKIDQETGEELENTGARGRLIDVAGGDVKFRTDIYETSFQDAAGKNRYGFVLPSFFLTKMREYQNYTEKQLKDLQSKKYEQYNPLFAHENLQDIFSEIKAVFVGDFRDDIAKEEGTTFKTTNSKNLLLSWYSDYTPGKSHIHTPMIYEAKSTSIAVRMPALPVQMSNEDGSLTKEATKYIFDTIFKQEHQRINGKVLPHLYKKENKHVWLNLPFFNNLTAKDGRHFSEIPFSELDSLEGEITKIIKDSFEAEIEAHKDELVKYEIIDNANGTLRNNLLKADIENLNQYISEFFMTDFVNSLAISQLVQGDLAESQKFQPNKKNATKNDIVNAVFQDVVKRNGGLIAYGSHFGEGDYKVIYKESYYDEDGNDTDDAQVWVSLDRRIDQLRRLGRLDSKKEAILLKLNTDEKLTEAEIAELDLIPMKTVHYDRFSYHKMSETVLFRKAVSKPIKDKEGNITGWVAREGKQKAHNMLNMMEEAGADSIVTMTASKRATGWVKDANGKKIKQARPISDDAFRYGTMPKNYDVASVPNNSLRLQLENNSGKIEIISGTQMAQLIDLGYVNDGIRDAYYELLAGARSEDFRRAQTIARNNEMLRDKLINSIEASQGDSQLIELLELNPDGTFKYDFNLPHVVQKLESLMISHFSKGVLQQKVPGYKVTLMSANGFEVYDPATKTSRPLKMHYEEDGTIKQAEVMMTRRQLAKIVGPFTSLQKANEKLAEMQGEKLLEMVGTRIPTQAHHSMIPFKVVEFLHEAYGDTIIAPAGITSLSGADYDIDSMYIYRRSFYKGLDGEWKLYGTAQTKEEKFHEYHSYHKSQKEVKKLIKKRAIANMGSGLSERAANTKATIEVFDELGIAIDQESFDTLESYEKRTNGARNNLLVDIYKEILTDASVPDLFDPVKLEPLSDAAYALNDYIKQDEKSQEIHSQVPNHYGLQGKLKAHTGVATGKQNVGPAAAANSASAWYTKHEIELTNPISFMGKDYSSYGSLTEEDIMFETKDGKVYIAKDLVTKSKIDSQSTVVSGMTDDAKEGFSARLNLEVYNLGTLMHMISLGMGFNRSMLFIAQPVLKELSFLIRVKGMKQNDALDTLMEKYNADRGGEFTAQELADNMTERNAAVDADVLVKFKQLSEASAPFQKVGSKALSLNKGADKITSVFDVVQRLSDLADVEGYGNQETEEPIYTASFAEAMNRDKNLTNNIKLFREMYGELGGKFIAASEPFAKLMKKLENSISRKAPVKSKTNAFRELQAYATAVAFKRHIKDLGHEFTPSDYIALMDPSMKSDQFPHTLASLIARYSNQEDKARAEEFKNNPFIQVLSTQFKFKDGKLNPNNEDKLDKVFTDSRTKHSPLVVDNIRNGFNELLLDSEYKNLAILFFRYYLAKDAMMFKDGTFAKFMDVSLFKTISESLQEYVEDPLSDEELAEFFAIWGGYRPNLDIVRQINPSNPNYEDKLKFNVEKKKYIAAPDLAATLPVVFKIKDSDVRYIKVSKTEWAVLPPHGTRAMQPYLYSYRENRAYDKQRLDQGTATINDHGATIFKPVEPTPEIVPAKDPEPDPGIEPTVEPKPPKTTGKKSFTYQGVTVNTEFELGEEQADALTKILDFITKGEGPAYTLEGYAGTGKTTIIGIADQILKKISRSYEIRYTAPTHAATVQLARTTAKLGASQFPATVPSAIKYDKRKKKYAFSRKMDLDFGVPVIIVDEVSMLDYKDDEKLIQAVTESGGKVIFMGDPAQIPKVGKVVNNAKRIAPAFSKYPKSTLTTVYRQKQGPLLRLLTKIRESNVFKVIPITESAKDLQVLAPKERGEELAKDMQENPEGTLVITYTNKGVMKANRALRGIRGFTGQIQKGDEIIGYIGYENKQIENGNLANSVKYTVQDIIEDNDDYGVTIVAESKELKDLNEFYDVPSRTSFQYMPLSMNNPFGIKFSETEIEQHREQVKTRLKEIHEIKMEAVRGERNWANATAVMFEKGQWFVNRNIEDKYIYNPANDQLELYDGNRHYELGLKNKELILDKGVDYGYAITIHKSQGLTVDNVYFDLESVVQAPSDPAIMNGDTQITSEKNALYYVGMSRASNKVVLAKSALTDIGTNPEQGPKGYSTFQKPDDIEAAKKVEGGYTKFKNPFEQRVSDLEETPEIIEYNFEKAIKRLSKRFKIPVEWVNEPQNKWRGRYAGGIVFLNKAHLKGDTPFHEFAHPFVEAIKKENPALFKALKAEVKAEGQIFEYVQKVYPDLDLEGQYTEAIVEAIGRMANEQMKLPKTLVEKIKDFLRKAMEWIKSQFDMGSVILPAELDPNTSLQDLSALLTKGVGTFELGDTSVDGIFEQRRAEYAKRMAVQESHVDWVRRGSKTSSVRDPELEVPYTKGEKVYIYANGQNQGIEVEIKDVKRWSNFSELTEEQKDEFAIAQGYDNWDDFTNANKYAHADTAESLRYPSIYNFINNEESIDLITYEVKREFEPSTPSKIEERVSKIKANLYKQIQTYKAKLNKFSANYEKRKAFITKSERLLEALMTVDEAAAIKIYIEEAQKDLRDAQKTLTSINKAMIDPANMTELERQATFTKFSDMQEFIKAYDYMTTTEMADLIELLGEDSETLGEFEKVVAIHKDLTTTMYDTSIPLLASWLMTYSSTDSVQINEYFQNRLERIRRSDKTKEEKDLLIKELTENKENFVLTQESLEAQLRQATKDISFGAYWLGAAASSSDQVTALISKAVEQQEFVANVEDRILQERMGRALKEYVAKKGKKNINNPKKFYDQFFKEIPVRYGSEAEAIVEQELVLRNSHPDPDVNKLLQEFRQIYREQMDKLPETHSMVVTEMGTKVEYMRMPFTRISGYDSIRENGIVATMKQEWQDISTPLASDDVYGYQTPDGDPIRAIPIYYTSRGIGDKRLENKDISKDIMHSLLKFGQMSNKYNQYRKIQAQIELLDVVIDNRTSAATNLLGIKKLDPVLERFGVKEAVRSEDDNVNRRLREFINMQFYGIQEEPWTFKMFGKEIDLNKLLNFIGKWTGWNTLALNFLSAINNMVLGNFYIFQESVARQNFGDLDFNLRRGKTLYAKGMTRIVGDIGKLSGLSKETQLIRLYDAIQGDFRDISGGYVTGTRAKKAWNTSALFFLNHAGEHEMQVSTLFSALAGTEVRTDTGETMSLWDAYELDEDGMLQIKEGVQWSVKDLNKLRKQLHATNKSLHGNYNDFDKAVLQKHAVGRLMLMFRKFIYPGVRRRFAKEQIDQELGEIHEGYFMTTIRLLRSEIAEVKKFLLMRETGLTDLEKANLKRTLIEVGALFTTMAMFALLSAALDDDDSYLSSLLLYEVRRFQTELGFYMSPGEALKIIKSPMASMTLAERVLRLLDQLVHIFNYDYTHYKVSGHGHKKGDSKLWDATKDLMPVLQGIERSKYPEQAIKYFDQPF